MAGEEEVGGGEEVGGAEEVLFETETTVQV